MILEIDMHIRDERLFDWLLINGNRQIPSHEIAKVFKCHRHTASAMVNRLEQAGKITVIRSRRGGHTIICKQNCY